MWSPVDTTMKRLLNSLLLVAFLAGTATPCQGAFMRCGMEMPSASDRCGSCDASDPSGASLRAGTCCSVQPGQVRDAAPALVSAAATHPSLEKAAVVAGIAGAAFAAFDRASGRAFGPPEANGPPAPPRPTPVLRL